MFGRGFGNGLWTGETIRPTARMAGKKLGQLACCNAPNGQGYCFDSGTGVCVMTWISGSGAPPGSPSCVQNPQGEWVHPGCPGVDAPPPGDGDGGDGGRPCLPPGCRYVAAPDNPMQEVICECFNCDTRESNSWRGMLGQFTAMGLQNPCLASPRWFPKPAQCPSGGEDYVPPPDGGCPPTDGVPPPPTDGVPPPTDGVPPPTPECPSGLIPAWDGSDRCCTPREAATQPDGSCIESYECFDPPDYTSGPGLVEGGVDPSLCEAAPPDGYEGGLACPTDGTYDLYDAVTGEHIASGVAEADLPEGAEIVAIDDPRCGPPLPPSAPGAPGDGGFPGGLPGGVLPPGPLPPPMAPGLPVPPEGAPIPTKPMPGMPGAPQAPAQNPFTQRFVPCGGQPPINVRSLKTETLPSRPDSWQDQWSRI